LVICQIEKIVHFMGGNVEAKIKRENVVKEAEQRVTLI
jgi:hypothetical protein